MEFHKEVYWARILFLIYINGLCQLQIAYGRITAFADNTALIFATK